MVARTYLENLLAEARHISDPEQRLSIFSRLNPEVTNLGTAENVIIFDWFESIFQDSASFAVGNTKYAQPFYGEASLREMTASLLSEVFESDLDPEHISGVSGTSAALECLAFALFSPGESVLMPTPYWQGFKWCFEQRPGMSIIPVDLYPDSFELTLTAIQEAYEAASPKPRALVLTNPHNPLGINYDDSLLEDIYEWVLNNTEMHIISDELYCHSQISRIGPAFKSAFALDAYNIDKERVHIVWGFAKDFGLSGFKAGFAITTNQTVHDEIRGASSRYGWFSPFDSLKNFMLGNLLSAQDGQLVRDAMQSYQGRLTTAFATIQTMFDEVPDIITYEPTRAAQFFWLDLRAYLDRVPPTMNYSLKNIELLRHPESTDAENDLLTYLAETAYVELLPGQTLSCVEPGFYRLCFTCEPLLVVQEAVSRMIIALEDLPPA